VRALHVVAERIRRTAALLLASALLFSGAASADEARLIVKLKDAVSKSAPTPKARIAKLAQSTGMALVHRREMALGADVVTVTGASEADAARVAAQLAADPAVEYASVDRRRHALQSIPVNDIFAPEQRYLRNDPSAISAFAAWDVTHGSSRIVVAVVDSGVLPHAGWV